MNGQHKYARNWEQIVATAIVGVALAVLLGDLSGAPELACNVHYETAWVAVEVLRHVVEACWQLVPTYLYDNSGCYEHLFRIVASIWPLLCVIAG
jgi:hypothetical protein